MKKGLDDKKAVRRKKNEPFMVAAVRDRNSEKEGERPFAEVVREVSQAMTSLLESGLNRKGIVTLLKDETGLGKSEINRVLDGLGALEKRYCK